MKPNHPLYYIDCIRKQPYFEDRRSYGTVDSAIQYAMEYASRSRFGSLIEIINDEDSDIVMSKSLSRRHRRMKDLDMYFQIMKHTLHSGIKQSDYKHLTVLVYDAMDGLCIGVVH